MKNTRMKITKQLFSKILILVLVVMFVYSCDKDDHSGGSPTSPSGEVLKSLILEGSLLIDASKQGDKTHFVFETDTLDIPSVEIRSLEIDKDKWNTKLTFSDNSVLEIPTLGNAIKIDKSQVKLNPTGYAPLSAQLTYSAPVEGKIKMRIKSKNKNVEDITHLFTKYGYNHQIYLHGLYANYNNTVYISLTDKDGNERATDSVTIKTEPISIAMPEIRVSKSDASKMEAGLTLVSYIGDHEYDTSRPFMIDAAGEVRWFLSLKGHPLLQYFAACSGLKRLKDGNFLTAGLASGLIYELNMVGEVIKTWDIGAKGYDFHRDIIEIPNGNFILAATNKNSVGGYVFDEMIEVNRETGAIVTVWDFKQSLDENRKEYTDHFSPKDWAHQNGIAYSESDDAVIVSHRFQGVAKLDRNNRVKWILSPHRGWTKNRRNEMLAPYLLQPLDGAGNKIQDEDVKNGYRASDSFDWSWGAHCPVLLSDGKLLLFDNGYYRHYDAEKDKPYSRAVEYRISESGMTIQQTWEFGKELGKNGYSSIVSSAQYLPQTDHILFGSGAIGFVGKDVNAQGGGRIVEVDYKTKQIVFDVEMQVPNFYVFHRVMRIALYPDNE